MTIFSPSISKRSFSNKSGSKINSCHTRAFTSLKNVQKKLTKIVATTEHTAAKKELSPQCRNATDIHIAGVPCSTLAWACFMFVVTALKVTLCHRRVGLMRVRCFDQLKWIHRFLNSMLRRSTTANRWHVHTSHASPGSHDFVAFTFFYERV